MSALQSSHWACALSVKWGAVRKMDLLSCCDSSDSFTGQRPLSTLLLQAKPPAHPSCPGIQGLAYMFVCFSFSMHISFWMVLVLPKKILINTKQWVFLEENIPEPFWGCCMVLHGALEDNLCSWAACSTLSHWSYTQLSRCPVANPSSTPSPPPRHEKSTLHARLFCLSHLLSLETIQGAVNNVYAWWMTFFFNT